MEFISQFKKYTLVLKPQKKVIVDNEVSLTDGIRIHFQDSMYATEDETIIDLMKKNKMFGTHFYEKPVVDLTKAPEVEAALAQKNKEIAELKAQIDGTTPPTGDPLETIFKCEECETTSTTKAGILAHQRSHSNQKLKTGF